MNCAVGVMLRLRIFLYTASRRPWVASRAADKVIQLVRLAGGVVFVFSDERL